MDKESIKDFLDQFENARKEIESWPRWMQENARVASASLPKSGIPDPKGAPTSSSKKKE